MSKKIKITVFQPKSGTFTFHQELESQNLVLDLSHYYLISTNCIAHQNDKNIEINIKKQNNIQFVKIINQSSNQDEYYYVPELKNHNILKSLIAVRHKVNDKDIKLKAPNFFTINNSSPQNNSKKKETFILNNTKIQIPIFQDCSYTQKIIEIANYLHIPMNLITFKEKRSNYITDYISKFSVFINQPNKQVREILFSNKMNRISDVKNFFVEKYKIQKFRRNIRFYCKNHRVKDTETLFQFANDRFNMKTDIEITFLFNCQNFFRLKLFLPIDITFDKINNLLKREIAFNNNNYLQNDENLLLYYDKDGKKTKIKDKNTLESIKFPHEITVLREKDQQYLNDPLIIIIRKLLYYIFVDLWQNLYNNLFNKWDVEEEYDDNQSDFNSHSDDDNINLDDLVPKQDEGYLTRNAQIDQNDYEIRKDQVTQERLRREEENKRKERERRIKAEEDKRIQQEELKRKKREDDQRKAEEKRRKEAEERKRREEAERIRKEAEERKRKEEAERQRREAEERQRIEEAEERIRIEEAERQRKEEAEERQRIEKEERIRREEAERQRKEEEERQRKEEEDRQRREEEERRRKEEESSKPPSRTKSYYTNLLKKSKSKDNSANDDDELMQNIAAKKKRKDVPRSMNTRTSYQQLANSNDKTKKSDNENFADDEFEQENAEEEIESEPPAKEKNNSKNNAQPCKFKVTYNGLLRPFVFFSNQKINVIKKRIALAFEINLLKYNVVLKDKKEKLNDNYELGFYCNNSSQPLKLILEAYEIDKKKTITVKLQVFGKNQLTEIKQKDEMTIGSLKKEIYKKNSSIIFGGANIPDEVLVNSINTNPGQIFLCDLNEDIKDFSKI